MVSIVKNYLQGFDDGTKRRLEEERRNALAQAGKAFNAGQYDQAEQILMPIDPEAGIRYGEYGATKRAERRVQDIGRARGQGGFQGVLDWGRQQGDFDAMTLAQQGLDAEKAAAAAKEADNIGWMSRTLLTFRGSAATPADRHAAFLERARARGIGDAVLSQVEVGDFTDDGLTREAAVGLSLAEQINMGLRSWSTAGDGSIGYVDPQTGEWVSNTGERSKRVPQARIVSGGSGASIAQGNALALGSGDFSTATRLRTEFAARGGAEYDTLAATFQNMRAAAALNTGAGDISLVYAYMKMLDPTSVVREGEFATAEQAGGVPEKVINTYNRLIKGERLSPQVRADFLNSAAVRLATAQEQMQNASDQYGAIAEARGIAPNEVVGTRQPVQNFIQTLPGGRRRMFARQTPGVTVTDLNTGQTYTVGRDGVSLQPSAGAASGSAQAPAPGQTAGYSMTVENGKPVLNKPARPGYYTTDTQTNKTYLIGRDGRTLIDSSDQDAVANELAAIYARGKQ